MADRIRHRSVAVIFHFSFFIKKGAAQQRPPRASVPFLSLHNQARSLEPGIATSGKASGPKAYFAGERSSLLASASSQVTSRPVYAAMRPMMAIMVDLHM